MKFEIYKRKGKWHWTLYAPNNVAIAKGDRAYDEIGDCVGAIRILSYHTSNQTLVEVADGDEIRSSSVGALRG